MEKKRIEIEGVTFNLEDSEDKKAAVRAWLEMRSRGRKAREASEQDDSRSGPPPEDEKR